MDWISLALDWDEWPVLENGAELAGVVQWEEFRGYLGSGFLRTAVLS